MSFVPKTGKSAGSVRAVTIGTGENSVTIGGSNALPFYTFDAPTTNPPAIGVEVSDLTDGWEAPGLARYYEGCATMAQRAKRASQLPGCAFVCLRFASADPNGMNRSVEACAADAARVAEAVDVPLVIMGCQNIEKDAALFTEVSRVLHGKNALMLSARSENHKEVAAAASLAYGHTLGAETADDVNLAKQLNIMLMGMGVPADGIVMNIGTAAVGYGFEYVASTMDRVRLAALNQGDTELQMPMIAPVSADTWGVKESTATEEDEPAWGCREVRAVEMEIATAAACLTSGADAVILRHPESVAAVKRLIDALC